MSAQIENGVAAIDVSVKQPEIKVSVAEQQEDFEADVSIALVPSDIASVPGLVKEISAFESIDDKEARFKLLASARALVNALETPRETMIKHNWAQPGLFAALAVCVNLGLFKELAKNGGSPKKVADLAEVVKCDAGYLGRLMRHISSMGYLKEVGADMYQPTNFTTALTIPIIGDGYPCLAAAAHEAVYKLPEYLISTNYQNTATDEYGAYQYAFETEHNLFGYLQAHPPHGMQFNHHMGGYRQGRPAWMDAGFFPVEEKLINGARTDADAVMLVDVGGNLGHDIMEFQRKHPEAPGKLILQDLPRVINQIETLHEKVEPMPHDFYTEQPVKGARAYYMHSCLHDWTDETCVVILRRLADAMKPGYSKLLINENVIPNTNADWQATALDMMMMTLLSSKERTEQDWYDLLEKKAGFVITKIWTPEGIPGVESLIECELPLAN